LDTSNHLTTNLVAGALTSTHLSIRTLMPLLLAVLAQTSGFGDAQLGDLGAAYSAGATIAALTSVVWMRGLRMRLPAALMLALGLVGLGGTLWVKDYAGLMLLFVLAGIGHGGVFALMIALLARTDDPDRSYGWQWCLGSIPGVILVYLAPALTTHANALWMNFGLVLGVNALIGLAILRLPVRLAPVPQATSGGLPARSAIPLSVFAALLAVFAMYSGITGCWAFLGRIAMAQDLPRQFSGIVLAVATAASSIVSLLAGELGNRGARPAPMTAAVAVMLLSFSLFVLWPGRAGYAVGTVVGIALSGFVLPFGIGLVSRLDAGGRAGGLPAAALGIGAIGGPAIAGHVYQAAGNAAMLAVSGGTIFLGLLAYLAVYGRAYSNRR
jgi:predicted MFS family arabinose efflux permease